MYRRVIYDEHKDSYVLFCIQCPVSGFYKEKPSSFHCLHDKKRFKTANSKNIQGIKIFSTNCHNEGDIQWQIWLLSAYALLKCVDL